MASAAPVIARNLFLICHLVACWDVRHDARRMVNDWLRRPSDGWR
jgi:hypothetical protein